MPHREASRPAVADVEEDPHFYARSQPRPSGQIIPRRRTAPRPGRAIALRPAQEAGQQPRQLIRDTEQIASLADRRHHPVTIVGVAMLGGLVLYTGWTQVIAPTWSNLQNQWHYG